METYQLGSGEFTPRSPQFTQDVRQGTATESVSETVNIAAAGHIKDAAGSTGILEFSRTPILDKYGGQIGSFWGSPQNLQYTAKVQGLTKTDGSADFAVHDPNTDLEKIFESVTSGRYVAKLTDGAGNVLYGWIGGVAVSSSVYTFSIFNGVGLGTQNWFQGDATSFALDNGVTVEIYRYSTSLTLGSSDTFTEEVPYHDPDDPRKIGQTEFRLLASLTNGQYAVNYKFGRVLVRKANADDTEVFTYRTYKDADTVVQAEDAASASGDSGVPLLTVRQDTPASSTSADGDYQSTKSDAKGYTWTREGYAPKYEDSTAERAIIGKQPTINSDYTQSNKIFDGTAATVNVKATAGVLGGFTFYNSGATLLYVQFFNDANTAAGAQVPDLGSFPLPGTTGISIGADYFIANQHHFATGIAVGISSTADDYTAHGTPSEVTGQISFS